MQLQMQLVLDDDGSEISVHAEFSHLCQRLAPRSMTVDDL